jgi:hypothetical protein
MATCNWTLVSTEREVGSNQLERQTCWMTLARVAEPGVGVGRAKKLPSEARLYDFHIKQSCQRNGSRGIKVEHKFSFIIAL